VASGGFGRTKYGGFFFTSEPENAQFYADQKELQELNPNFVSAYGEGDEWYYSASDEEGNNMLNGGKFKTPELAKKAGRDHVKRYNDALRRKEDMFVRGYNLKIENPLEVSSQDMRAHKWSPAMLIPLAKDAGKDGVIVRDFHDGAMASDIYIVFDGSQIQPSKTGQLQMEANDQSFDIVITGKLNTDTGVDDAPAEGNLDTQLFENCEGTKFDRDVVGKCRRRLKKHKAEHERDINGEMIDELNAEWEARWIPVESSAVKAVSYVESRQRMEFLMHNGRIYSFHNIPVEKFIEFVNLPESESKGKWFADLRKRNMKTLGKSATSKAMVKTAASWGTAGSGVMYLCPEDNSVLLLKRSLDVMDGGLWGIPGGAVKGTEGFYDESHADGRDFDEETLKASAHTEVEEEMGHIPDGQDIGSVTIPFGKFKYTTFFKAVKRDQKDAILAAVELNWESTDKGWFSLTGLPKNVHPGVLAAIQRIPR